MKINTVENSIGDSQARQAVRNLTAGGTKPEGPASKQESPKTSRDAAHAPQPQRRPPLTQIINKSLTDAGVQVGTPSVVQAADASSNTQSSNDLERAQSEKVAQALQAFMHTLVQATAAEQSNRTGEPSKAASTTTDSNSPQPVATQPAVAAYAGLVSKLEGLAQKLDGSANPAESSQGIPELNSAFRDLLTASGENQATGSTAAPQLQEVIRNIARNLQSTGNPNLATTGNVINTAA